MCANNKTNNKYTWDIAKILLGAIVGFSVSILSHSLWDPPAVDKSDVADEWVIIAKDSLNEEEAWNFRYKFYNLPAKGQSGDCLFGSDQVHVVRSLWNKGNWAVVIDALPGESEKDEMLKRLEKIKLAGCKQYFTNASVRFVNSEDYYNIYKRRLSQE
ncbi:MAG: hypothetical protein P8075_11625 [Deltaproteobacteria bacterium]|jgi:hypothetical protein